MTATKKPVEAKTRKPREVKLTEREELIVSVLRKNHKPMKIRELTEAIYGKNNAPPTSQVIVGNNVRKLRVKAKKLKLDFTIVREGEGCKGGNISLAKAA